MIALMLKTYGIPKKRDVLALVIIFDAESVTLRGVGVFGTKKHKADVGRLVEKDLRDKGWASRG